jgi:hypothetical protein
MNRSLFTGTLAGIALALSVQVAAAQNTAAAAAPVARPAAAAQAAQPMIPENPAITRRALEWVGRFQTTNIDRSQLNATIDTKLTPQVLEAMKRQLAPLGTATGIGYGGARNVKGALVYRYVVVFPVGAIQEFMSIGADGKIAGVLFLPVR